ncbi:tripartite tricarboxylate transporter substrate binding protein [Pigmentiphaga soli]|uniref:Tripartite tricarboxylate transporter substrate binding protein n=1 Tax=Pigmentiphaga soli TaxID=1007095 RepID=A0ABP8HE84_9BURK
MIHCIPGLARRLMMSALAACALGGAPAARAEGDAAGFPDKPVRLVVPFAAGGSNDIMARYVASKLGPRLGQSVVVDNKAGANSIIGSEFVSTSAPDGYTLLIISNAFTTNPAVYHKLPYDPVKSFTPVALLGTGPNVLAVWPGLGVKSLAELVALAKSRRAEPLTYASSGLGGIHHFTGEIFQETAGITMTHIPYKGAGNGMNDVMSGHVQVLVNTVASALPQIRNGSLKAVAIDNPTRIPVLPDIPTIAESYPQWKSNAVWWGIIGPAGMPAPVVQRLNREINAVLRTPEVRDWMQAQSAQAAPSSPDEFGQRIGQEITKYKALAQSAHIAIN